MRQVCPRRMDISSMPITLGAGAPARRNCSGFYPLNSPNIPNLHEAAYVYPDSRESEVALVTLADFKGVVVSDFYSGYDLLACPQQRCLLHLVRDLNAEMLRNPYDEELKRMISGFAQLLKEVVETVDRFGLKRHFLRKHHRSVGRFHRQIMEAHPQSEAALKCQQRFQKNRDKLFTFLDYDGVPWNNNNAEHAIKAFASLRDVIEGSSNQKGLEEYKTAPSACRLSPGRFKPGCQSN